MDFKWILFETGLWWIGPLGRHSQLHGRKDCYSKQQFTQRVRRDWHHQISSWKCVPWYCFLCRYISRRCSGLGCCSKPLTQLHIRASWSITHESKDAITLKPINEARNNTCNCVLWNVSARRPFLDSSIGSKGFDHREFNCCKQQHSGTYFEP